jgi:hypothetical protein
MRDRTTRPPLPLVGFLMAILLLVLAFACPDAFAQRVTVCDPRSNCRPFPTWISPTSPVPFNAPLQFHEERRIGNSIAWVWRKAGEPPRPCTNAEANNGPAYRKACAAQIGEPFIVTPPIMLAPN